MSVVAIVIKDDYALIMGDTKLNDNPNVNHITKVFKKDNILLGYTGRLSHVREYLYPIFTDDMQLNENYQWTNSDNPTDFFKFLDEKFIDARNTNKHYDVVLAVAVKIEDKYIAKHYRIFSPEHPQWETDTIISSNEYQCLYLGNDIHFNYFSKLFLPDSISSYQDILQIFQDTLDYGIQYDATINNEMEWHVI